MRTELIINASHKKIQKVVFHAPVKFEILGFLVFHSVFFRLVERKHPKCFFCSTLSICV